MFRYRYEKILSIKIEDEDACKLELANAINAQEVITHQIESTNEQYDAFLEKLEMDMSVGMSAHEYQLIGLNKKYFKTRLEELEQELEVARHNVQEMREQLLLATREKKKYEKLKEKAFDEYVSAIEKQEAEVIDEFVSQKAVNLKM